MITLAVLLRHHHPHGIHTVVFTTARAINGRTASAPLCILEVTTARLLPPSPVSSSPSSPTLLKPTSSTTHVTSKSFIFLRQPIKVPSSSSLVVSPTSTSRPSPSNSSDDQATALPALLYALIDAVIT